MTEELRDNLNIIFDAKLTERSLEVTELENEVEALKAVDKRRQMKDVIVERRLAQMLAESDEVLSW